MGGETFTPLFTLCMLLFREADMKSEENCMINQNDVFRSYCAISPASSFCIDLYKFHVMHR